MTIAFTKALYYPWIDIEDEAWLKNAMLYWEQIQTITPLSIKHPYSTRTAIEFSEVGLLQPYHVHPHSIDIGELRDDVMKYLESPDGMEVVISNDISKDRKSHYNKFSNQIGQLVEIHLDKFAPQILARLFGKVPLRGRGHDQWIRVDPRFANFYLTLLATHIAQKCGIGLLTDTAANNRLASSAKLGSLSNLTGDWAYRRRNEKDQYGLYHGLLNSMAQGTLADLVLEGIQIDPDTSVQKILKFRNKYKDELGRFRTEIAELTNAISRDQPIDALRQQVKDIYTNQVKPEMDSLKKGLTDCDIEWALKNFLKVAFYSTGSTSVPLILTGLSVPYALLVGVGVSLTASAILYHRDKASKLRQNPYSYLFALERVFHR